ncbi:MAG: hypothetical protein VW405_01965 [Rhodospirillaceae bacterium]
MMTLLQFMGGSDFKATGSDQTLGLGQGRWIYYRPSAAISLTLLDPTKDVFKNGGGPYYYIFNVTTGGHVITVRDYDASAIASINQDEVGVIGIRPNGSGRKWFGVVFDRLS